MADTYWLATPTLPPAARPIAFSQNRHLQTQEEKKSSKNGGKMAKQIWLILYVLILALISSVYSIDDKCSACAAIAEELERGLLKERPRNHLDMRHRLDSKGQRQGKVIDYRVSELRVVELLDDLCDKMQDYTLEKVDSGNQVWIKVHNWDILKSIDKQEAKAYAKDISSFCGRLLEETEDELSELIKQGSVKVGDVNKVLCEDLSKYCQKTSSRYGDDKDVHGEL